MSNSIDGYSSSGKVLTGWWDTQLAAGIASREKHTREARWPEWDKYYQGDYADFILPVNLFFMMARTLIPRIYFRNPSLSITPGKPGPEHLGLAKINERVANKLMRSMRIKQAFKSITQETFFHGTGVGKLGFGSEFAQPTAGVPVNTHDNKTGDKMDYRSGIEQDQPWFLPAAANELITPAGIKDFRAAPWFAHVVKRPVDDLSRDHRFDHVKNIEEASSREDHDGPADTTEQDAVPTTLIYEIHDRRTGKYFVYSPHGEDGKRILQQPVEDSFMSRNGGPMYPLSFNASNTSMWGLPDSQILEPLQKEINAIATQIAFHRRTTMRKFKALRNSITPEEASELVRADLDALGAIVWTDDMNSVEAIQTGGIPQELFLAFDKLMQMVQFTVGFSRNQFGEFRGGSEAPTATEANIVQQATEIRIDERRDIIADTLIEVMQDALKIAYTNWDNEQVEQILGPYGVPIWVKYTPEMMLRGHFEIKTDPDSSIPETKQAREQKALQLSQMLLPLADVVNPLTGRPDLDKNKILRYLLHELHGTEYDDMLLGVPNIYDERYVQALQQGGAAENTPISAEQFGQLTQQAGTPNLEPK